MKTMKNTLSPKAVAGGLALVLAWNCLVYGGSRLVTAGRVHISMELPFDRAVPFLPWTAAGVIEK